MGNKRKFKFFKILKFFLDKDLGGIYIGHQFDNLDGFTLVFLHRSLTFIRVGKMGFHLSG